MNRRLSNCARRVFVRVVRVRNWGTRIAHSKQSIAHSQAKSAQLDLQIFSLNPRVWSQLRTLRTPGERGYPGAEKVSAGRACFPLPISLSTAQKGALHA